MCPSIEAMTTNQLTYIRVDHNKLTTPISTYALFCFPHLRTIYYGAQNVNVKKPTQLRTPVFRRFLTPEEYEEAEDDRDHETEEDHEAEDHYFHPYFQ